MTFIVVISVLSLVVMVAVIALIAWAMNKPARDLSRRSAKARALRPQVVSILQASPMGARVEEIAAATGLVEEDVRSCLGGLVQEGQVHQSQGADDEGRYVTRFVWGAEPTPAPPPAKPTRPAASEGPYEPPPQGLPDRWLKARCDILTANVADLNGVHDILHPFYVCKQCRSESTSVTMLPGNLLGGPEQLRSVLEQLGKNPEALGVARKSGCSCGGKATLRRIVVCRTNPSRQNDLHLTIDSHRRATPRVSFLMLDGQYEHLPEDGFARVLGG